MSIPLESPARLTGELILPDDATGLVVSVGGEPHGPQERHLARALRRSGLATLRVELLTKEELDIDRRTGHLRFDISLLARRVVEVVDWLARGERTAALPIALLGAGTGAPAVLVAAALRPRRITAVVSHFGQPDLAGDALPVVRAPTLLIVSLDRRALAANREALGLLGGERELVQVAGAGAASAEPEVMEQVASLARDWFLRHPLTPGPERLEQWEHH